jgi:TonB-dependent receptor
VDNRFVVVRGLSERYSNTLLNGVEVTSPEPAKKVVPLDIFPASLLDAIVVTKSATPDKPGDFSGGSVEIRTKEFPEQRTYNYSLSVGYNSLTTGKEVQLPSWRGIDFLGFDAGKRRQRPALPTDFNDAVQVERFSEAIRNTWNPATVRAAPNLGLGVTFGDQLQGKSNALGYVASITYSEKQENQPSRFFQFLLDPTGTPARGYVYNERRTAVDWGAVFNLSGKLGTNHKFGLKNFYTRNAEEQYTTTEGFNIDLNGDVRGYNYSYLSRDLWQSQLTGEHLGKLWVVPWRIEWKGTLSLSHRNEPDNRQVTYLRSGADPVYELGNNSDLWFRFLDDQLRGGQADLSVPLPWFGSRELQFKAGGSARKKVREFDASLATFNLDALSGLPNDIYTLPPHKLFTPDIIGDHMFLGFPGSVAQPYSADDQVVAYYGMLDVPIFSWLRVVGGMRVESWTLDLYDGGRGRFAADSSLVPTARRNTDPLWSANATITLTPNMNVRLAGFRSVARPDTREMSRDEYTELVGSCPTTGNPQLQRTIISNADARWEWYPGPGEIISVSGFFKYFEQPIIRTVSGEGNCRFSFGNGVDATNVGAELDIRKGLAFLPGFLTNLSVGVNAAYVQSKLTVDPSQGVFREDLPLEDQSPYLVNANLGWVDSRLGLDMSVLYNWFDDRINRYGFRGGSGPNAPQGPNIVERGRGTIDAKLQWRASKHYTVTLSARNLTDAAWQFYQETTKGRETTGYFQPGRSITMGVAYGR